ncbi:MAG: radical SAM protein [Planctomycetes bacterium]|nr:radical SAM protein [Planctomycetota bacterium]
MPFPFFLAYSTSLLRGAGFSALVVDAIAEGMDDDAFFQKMCDFSPDVVFLEVSAASQSADLAVLRRTRELFGPDVRIVFAGVHHDLASPDILARHPELDFAISGEYEFPLLALVRALSDNTDLAGIPGLAYRTASGEPLATPRGAPQFDLDVFPWPERDMLPMERYNDRPGGIPAPSLQVIASRGCPFGCVFCAWPQIMYGGPSYRTRSPKDVVDEIEHCIRRYGCNSFYFDDDTFNVGKPRILDLCAQIKQRRLGLPWAIMARADTMDREMLESMKDAGLTALKYGVESGSQDVLKKACKGLNLDKVRQTVAITRELGIHYHLTFMFGLPGETEETARQTMNLALELDADSAQFSIATPFPGSRFHDELLRKGHLMSANLDEYDGYHNAVVRTDALSHEQILALHGEATRAWQAHYQARRAGRP